MGCTPNVQLEYVRHWTYVPPMKVCTLFYYIWLFFTIPHNLEISKIEGNSGKVKSVYASCSISIFRHLYGNLGTVHRHFQCAFFSLFFFFFFFFFSFLLFFLFYFYFHLWFPYPDFHIGRGKGGFPLYFFWFAKSLVNNLSSSLFSPRKNSPLPHLSYNSHSYHF